MNLDRYIGIPHKPCGRSFDGVDCWGLVLLFYLNELRISLPDYGLILPTDIKQVKKAIEHRKKDWLTVDDPQHGDVVLMTVRAGSHRSMVSHTGVIISIRNRLHVLHNESSAGSIIQRLDNVDIASRVREYKRFQK